MNKIYLASIFILVGFYIPLIYLIGHPNVSAEYKSYYITQSSKISPFERANMGPIPFGEKIEFNDRRIGFENFFVLTSAKPLNVNIGIILDLSMKIYEIFY